MLKKKIKRVKHKIRIKKKEEEEYKRKKKTNKRRRVKHKVRIVTKKNHMNNNSFAYFCERDHFWILVQISYCGLF